MRVFYVTNGVQMGHYHYAQNFLRGLDSVADVSVDVYYIEDDEEAEFPGARTASPLATAISGSRLLDVVATLRYHLRFLLHLVVRRPDVVHFNTEFRNQYHTYGLTLLAKLAGARVLRTVHEITPERLGDVSERERRMAYRNLRAADHLIVHSDAVVAELRDEGVETPTTVLPHGNYLCFREYLDPDADPPLPTDGKPVVLFFGPKKHKGIEVFADAVAESEADFTTWIAGAVADDAEAAVSRLADRSDVYVERSYILDEELPSYFDHADIALLPYISGTTSGAVHLARAFETAVATSDLPYFRSVVEDGVDGYVLEETTPSGLAEALEELVAASSHVESIASAGLETERSDRFDWGRIAAETAEAYRTD